MPESRVGIGHDRHRLAAGKPLRIGGVLIEGGLEVVAHSDGDVLLHALTDALLGAAALGDIGEWFSDRDPANAGRDSAEFVTAVVTELASRGWKPLNVDSTVMLERPRLSHYKHPMRVRIAELVGLPVESVNVKAKSGEALGPVGRGEAVEAEAVVLISRP